MKKTTLLMFLMMVAVITVVFSSCKKHTHEYGEWSVLKEATCTEEGVKERLCSCGEKETSVIQSGAHAYGEWTVLNEATCLAEGLRERICSYRAFP